jgi:hypothetical protein
MLKAKLPIILKNFTITEEELEDILAKKASQFEVDRESLKYHFKVIRNQP